MSLVTLDRRGLLERAGLLGALGTIWSAEAGAASADEIVLSRGHLVVDVACLGTTFAPDLGAALGAPADLRGTSFSVEGNLYPGGTIAPGPGFDPDAVESIGHWLCTGWFLINPARPEPHVITTQEYTLSRIVEGDLSPRHTLVSYGVEGDDAGTAVFTRAIVGGSGRYRHVRGHVTQRTVGTNVTLLNVFGGNAPNFRFAFEF